MSKVLFMNTMKKGPNSKYIKTISNNVTPLIVMIFYLKEYLS